MVILGPLFITAQIVVIVAVLLHRSVDVRAGNRDPRHSVRVFFLCDCKAFVRRFHVLGLYPCRQDRSTLIGTPEKQEPDQQ